MNHSLKMHKRSLFLCLLALIIASVFFIQQKELKKQRDQIEKENEKSAIRAMIAVMDESRPGHQKLPHQIILNKRLTVGLSHFCFVSMANNINCFGENDYGQLGAEDPQDPTKDKFVVWPVSPTSQIDAGWNHTCAIGKDDALYCWGNNDHGQLAVDPAVYPKRTDPKPVENILKTRALGMGKDFSCAVTHAGQVYCWGNNDHGQLGRKIGSHKNYAPQLIKGLEDIVDIDGGSKATCSVNENGDLFCWGSNEFGQMANDVPKNYEDPKKIMGIPPVLRIAVGHNHVCALTKDQNVWCWGNNDFGQLGLGSKIASAIPQKVPGLDKIVNVTTGVDHSCALNEKGEQFCWGYFSGDNPDNPTVTCYQTSLVPIRNIKSEPVISNIAAGVRSDLIRREPFAFGFTHIGSYGHFAANFDINQPTGPGTIELGEYSSFLLDRGLHFLIGFIETGNLGLTCTSPGCEGEIYLMEANGKFSELEGNLADISNVIHIDRMWGGGTYKVAYAKYKTPPKNLKEGPNFGSLDGEFGYVLAGKNLKNHLNQIQWHPMEESKEVYECLGQKGYKTDVLKIFKSQKGDLLYYLAQEMEGDNKKYDDPKFIYQSMGPIQNKKCITWYDSYRAYESKSGSGRELNDSFPQKPIGILDFGKERWILYKAYGYEWGVTALIPFPSKDKKNRLL
jgi:alpha-tubulin suppressor-like RCC1 family protein